MKNIRPILLACFLAISFLAFAQENPDGAKIVFEEPVHDFGDIRGGAVVSHAFKFRNSGNQPLVISNVVATCGCTATTWPKEPVLPGKSGEIQVNFDTRGRQGMQSKVVTIISNGLSPQTRIKVTANIVPR